MTIYRARVVSPDGTVKHIWDQEGPISVVTRIVEPYNTLIYDQQVLVCMNRSETFRKAMRLHVTFMNDCRAAMKRKQKILFHYPEKGPLNG